MKINNIVSSLLLVGAIGSSGSASAAVFAFGTVNQWLTGGLTTIGASQAGNIITDADGDSQFAFQGLSGDLLNIANAGDWIDVNLSEQEVNGKDVYDISFDFNITNQNSVFFSSNGYVGSTGDFEYTITSLSPEKYASARLDSIVLGGIGQTVTKDIYDHDGGLNLLQLVSSNGSQDPATDHKDFAAQQSIFVRDSLDTGSTTSASIQHLDNEFTTVPEPLSLIMLGIGLIGLSYSRREEIALGSKLFA